MFHLPIGSERPRPAPGPSPSTGRTASSVVAVIGAHALVGVLLVALLTSDNAAGLGSAPGPGAPGANLPGEAVRGDTGGGDTGGGSNGCAGWWLVGSQQRRR